MKFEFIAEMEDGDEIKVLADSRDLRRWEADYKRTMVGENTSFTYLAQVCYVAARRQRLLAGKYPTYATFDEACVDLKVERVDRDELVADPTPSAATADSSVS